MINYWRTADDDNSSNDDNSNNDDDNDNNNNNNNNSCNGKIVLHLDFIFLLQVGLQFVLFFCTSFFFFFFLASLFSVFCFIAVLIFLPSWGWIFPWLTCFSILYKRSMFHFMFSRKKVNIFFYPSVLSKQIVLGSSWAGI